MLNLDYTGVLLFVLAFLQLFVEMPAAARGESKKRKGEYMSAESRLVRELLDRYRQAKTLARPLRNSSQTITVNFGISLIQILDFDEKNQVLTTLIWKEYLWKDEFMMWDPEEFGGVTRIRLPGISIWTPDIILFNNVDKRDVEAHQEMLLIDSNGTVSWVPPVVYRSACQVDITNFPFDSQTCSLQFGSWTYAKKELDLHPIEREGHDSNIDLSVYMRSSEWDITETQVARNVKVYSCCDDGAYVSVTFSIEIDRIPDFYVRVMLLPTLLLAMMVVVIFWIPPSRPDRTTLGMSLFTSFLLLLLLVVESSPPSADSRLATFCCVNIVAVVTATLVSVFIVNLATRRHVMPYCFKLVFVHWLGETLCVCPKRFKRSTNGNKYKIRENTNQQEPALANQIQNEKPPNLHFRDWTVMATVLDRIFFGLYFIYIAICIIYVFPLPGLKWKRNKT